MANGIIALADEPGWVVTPEAYNSLAIYEDRGRGDGFVFRETSVHVKVAKVPSKWDVKAAAGSDGAKETYRGILPAKVDLRWTLWTRTHQDTFRRLVEAIRPKPGATAGEPVQVLHPQLALFGYEIFVVKSIGLPTRLTPDTCEVELELLQWFPQPKPTPKPDENKAITNLAPNLDPKLAPKIPVPPPKPSAAGKAAKP